MIDWLIEGRFWNVVWKNSFPSLLLWWILMHNNFFSLNIKTCSLLGEFFWKYFFFITQIHFLFIDFSKAFDLVDHSIFFVQAWRQEHQQVFVAMDTKLSPRQNATSQASWCTINNADLPGGCTTRICHIPFTFRYLYRIDDFDDSIPVELQGRVNMCKYADDCTASQSIPNGELSNMQKVLDGLQNWAATNNMLLNSKKTKDMWISFCKNSIEPDLLRRNDSCLERVSNFKLLGVWQQDNLCWNYHVEQTVKKASKRLYFLRECRKANLPTEIGITIYIVPKYAHFSNMPPHSGAVRRSTLQKSCSVYKTGVNYPTTWILLMSHRLEI